MYKVSTLSGLAGGPQAEMPVGAAGELPSLLRAATTQLQPLVAIWGCQPCVSSS